MGLRCLLGHDFGEPELEREREENGEEVVITVREVKTCSRCGEQQVVSENKEVTSIEQLAEEAATAEAEAAGETGEGAGDEGGRPTPSSGAGGPATRETTPEATAEPAAGDDDAVLIDDAEPATGGATGAEPATGGDTGAEPATGGDTGAEPAAEETRADATAADQPTAAEPSSGEPAVADSEGDEFETPEPKDVGAELIDEGPSEDERLAGADDVVDEAPAAGESEEPVVEDEPEEDDGVILDEEDESEPRERDHGEWPEMEREEAAESAPSPWPEQRGEDEGFSADHDDGTDAEVSFGGGLTPEAAAETPEAAGDEDVEYVEAPETAEAPANAAGAPDSEGSSGGGSGITSAGGPELGTTADDADTEYYCPECEMTRPANGNSMRAGDICPECKRGYVSERPR